MADAYRFTLHDDRNEVEQAEESLLTAIARMSYDDASRFAIRLALEEALSNAFKHGNQEDPKKVVQLSCRVDQKTIEIEVEDEGHGFDPATVPDPTETENIEIPAGRGLTLMRAFMTQVEIPPPGNRVRMTFLRPG